MTENYTVVRQLTQSSVCLIRASGKILKAYAQDFEALSKDGHLYVVVQNTGYVTADFSVSKASMDIFRHHLQFL